MKKIHYRLRGKHGTYVRSNLCYDIEEARKWRDEMSKLDRDKSIKIVRVLEEEEVVE